MKEQYKKVSKLNDESNQKFINLLIPKELKKNEK